MNASSSLCPFEYLVWRTQEKEYNTTFPTKTWFTDERSGGLPGSTMRDDRRTFDNDNYFDGAGSGVSAPIQPVDNFASTRRSILRRETGHDEPVDLRGVPKFWNVLVSISTGNAPEREGGIAHWLRVLVSSRKRAIYYCSSRSNRMLYWCCYPHRSTRELRAADVY